MSNCRVLKLAARVASLCALALCVLLIGGSGSAVARVVHRLEGTFNGSDTPDGVFGFVLADAADRSKGLGAGNVYVGQLTSGFESVVDRFEANGTYAGLRIVGSETPQGSLSLVSFSTFRSGGLAVDNSTSVNNGDLYVAATEAGVIDKFDDKGRFVCQITARPPSTRSPAEAEHECAGSQGSETPQGSVEPTGVAVDSSGHVDVVDSAEGHNVIDRFSPSGEYVGQVADQHIVDPTSIAVDAAGDLYVVNFSKNIVEFGPTGAFLSVLNEESPTGVEVDPSNGHVYVGVTFPIEQALEYDASGRLLDKFAEGHAEHAVGLAVGSSGQIYIADLFANAVSIFGPDVIVPDVVIGPAGIQNTNATLRGHVDPAGGPEVNTCEFEYGSTAAYGKVASCSPAPPYAQTTEVTANIGSVEKGSIYHFRLVAANVNGANQTEDHVFGPPAVDAETATAATTNAVIGAKIDPVGLETTCEVQYVPDESFQVAGYASSRSMPCAASVGWEAGERSATATLTGLQRATTYHYRVIAKNDAGEAIGEDRTFATFGIKSFSLGVFDPAGGQFDQAGGHPYEMVDSFTLSTTTNIFGTAGAPGVNVKDIRTQLPAGLIGNPDSVAKCAPYNVAHADCSGASQVGLVKIYTTRSPEGTESPLYNLVPPRGLAAQLGARFNGFATVHIDATIRTGGDYGVTAEVHNSSADEGVVGATVTIWGVPADSAHDGERYCPSQGKINEVAPCSERGAQEPFLTYPTSCTTLLKPVMKLNSWQEPEAFSEAIAETMPVTGCDRLDFKPTIAMHVTTIASDAPTGLHVHLHVPQNQDAGGLGEAALRDASIALPAGVVVNPSVADSLVGCTEAQIELNGPKPARCPGASKIGNVEVQTPLLEHPLKGGIYVAQQGNGGPSLGANPFGSLLAVYIAVEDPESGIVVKLAGKVSADPVTGKLTTTFDNNPELPFTDLELELFSGPRAPLVTPPVCGAYAATTSLTPWSAPDSGPPAGLSNSFQIASGPRGSACAPPSFAPTFIAGTTSNQGGGFGALGLTLSRDDGEQRMSTIATRMPPGLAGMLAGVPLCAEAQANIGTCPPTSQIGHVTITAGAGPDPIALPEPGKPQDPVYLTGPYKGAPFGLSVVVPAEAGPFNLDEGGHPIVVRAKVEVDPHTAQVSVQSDPMPTILQGIPVDLRSVSVSIDRERFIFNPTNCAPMAVDGIVRSIQGATHSASSRFQAAECRGLSFKPSFSASTTANGSRSKGASLHVVVKSTFGQANIRRVHVTLPKALPSRLSTLKQACSQAQFSANPSGCPAGSLVGTATAHTPVLPVALTGPAYFVSHGGAGFPDLVVVLQGDGVTVDLTGGTNVSKGITSSTFASVPDVPITRFDLTLPQGPHSALAAIGNLCKGKLAMPTTITGQNGAQIKRNTVIAVAGCRRRPAHSPHHHQKKRHGTHAPGHKR